MTYALSLLRAACLHVAGVAVWFAFCLSQPAFAAPTDPVYGACRGQVFTHGEVFTAQCGETGGTFYNGGALTVADLLPGDAVVGSIGWDYVWFNVSDMVGTEQVFLFDAEPYAWSEIGYPGGGDSDPDPDPLGEEFGLDDLDTEEILRAFSSGFFLVALFWGLGKGIALILQQVRRG